MILYRSYVKLVDLGTPSKSSRRQNPPTPANARRCQIKECRISENGQKLTLDGQSGLWFRCTSRFRPAQNQICSWFWLAFWQHQKTWENEACANQSKSQKIRSRTPKASILMTFWQHFRSPYLIYFPEHLYLLNCNRYNAKTFFYNFRPLFLVSKTNQQIMFFQTPFLNLILPILFGFFPKMLFLGPIQNPVGA